MTERTRWWTLLAVFALLLPVTESVAADPPAVDAPAASEADETDAEADEADAEADEADAADGTAGDESTRARGIAARARKKVAAQPRKRKPKVPPGETKWGKMADAFVRAHIAHVNTGDLDAYLADFVPEVVESAEHRDYSERVLGVLRPQIEVVVLQVEAVKHKAAHVHVVQRTTYVDEWGRDREDIALIKYNLREIGGAWFIASTTRDHIPELPDDDSIF